MFVNNKRLSILNIGGELSLMPGVNPLPENWNEKTWNDLADRFPKVQYLIDQDLLEAIFDDENSGDDDSDEGTAPAPQPRQRSSSNGLPPNAAKHLQAHKEKDAIKLVRETANDKLLTAWHEVEERPAVINAIEAQFEALAKAGEPK